jgi:prepilin-type N-terminal cleavage/methylation domain-containing protein
MTTAMPRKSRQTGMTLIEIMVVVVIIAMAATGVSMALGAVTRTKLRSSCMRIVAASRFAYNRAIAQGTTVRITFDFSKHTLAIEEAHGKVVLARAGDERVERAEGGGDRAGVDPWEAAEQRLQNALEPSVGTSPFATITNADGEPIERYQHHPVGDGIQIARLLTPHEPEPRTDGHGSIYFFPSGMTEHSVVQLQKSDGTVYSVEIHPLTGRGRVHNFAYEPESIMDEDAEDEDLSEVEDE